MFKKIKNLFAKDESPEREEVINEHENKIETITLVAPNGLRNEISKEEWVEKFLKPSLEKNWDDFEGLYKIRILKFIKENTPLVIWTPFLGHGNEVFICQN